MGEDEPQSSLGKVTKMEAVVGESKKKENHIDTGGTLEIKAIKSGFKTKKERKKKQSRVKLGGAKKAEKKK